MIFDIRTKMIILTLNTCCWQLLHLTGFVLQGHVYLRPLLSSRTRALPVGSECKIPDGFSVVKNALIFILQPRLSGDLQLPDLWLTAKHFHFDPNNFIRFIKAYMLLNYRARAQTHVCLTGLWEAAGWKRSAGSEGRSLWPSGRRCVAERHRTCPLWDPPSAPSTPRGSHCPDSPEKHIRYERDDCQNITWSRVGWSLTSRGASGLMNWL